MIIPDGLATAPKWDHGHVAIITPAETAGPYPALICDMPLIDEDDDEITHVNVRFTLEVTRRIIDDLNATALDEIRAVRTTDHVVMIETGHPDHPTFLVIEPEEMGEGGGAYQYEMDADGLYDLGAGYLSWQIVAAPEQPHDTATQLYGITRERLRVAARWLACGEKGREWGTRTLITAGWTADGAAELFAAAEFLTDPDAPRTDGRRPFAFDHNANVSYTVLATDAADADAINDELVLFMSPSLPGVVKVTSVQFNDDPEPADEPVRVMFVRSDKRVIEDPRLWGTPKYWTLSEEFHPTDANTGNPLFEWVVIRLNGNELSINRNGYHPHTIASGDLKLAAEYIQGFYA